jgi:hypothetical protein
MRDVLRERGDEKKAGFSLTFFTAHRRGNGCSAALRTPHDEWLR